MGDEPTKKPLGALLKEKGLLTEEQIKFALLEQKITGERLGELFERLGFVTEHDVVSTLASQSGVPYLDVDTVLPEEAALKMFNKNLCLNNLFLPIRKIEGQLSVTACDTADPKLAQLISRQTGLTPQLHISEKRKIINAIHRFYYFLENPVEKLIEKESGLLAQDTEMARGMDNFVRLLLHLAVKRRATDIHIAPQKKTVTISFRIDGVMVPVLSLHPSMHRVVASLKMKADMDIAEQRLPQD